MTVAMAPVARLRIRRRGARGDHEMSRRVRGHATDRISCAERISLRRRRHPCDATRRPHAAFTKRPPRRLGGPLESLTCRRMLPAAGPSQADGRDACIPASSFRAPSPDEPGGHSEAIPKRPRIPMDGPIPTGPSTPIVVPRGGPGSLKSGKVPHDGVNQGPGWSPPPKVRGDRASRATVGGLASAAFRGPVPIDPKGPSIAKRGVRSRPVPRQIRPAASDPLLGPWRNRQTQRT